METTGPSQSKRARRDRHGGELLLCHARPLAPNGRPRRHPPRVVDSGLHFTVARDALKRDDIEWALRLQRDTRPDQLDADTAAFVGDGRLVWSVWPKAQGSAVSGMAAARARELVNGVLGQIGACPACGNGGREHRVHEVELMHYKGSGAACPVHTDSPLPNVACPVREQGALLVTLKQDCQGGVLYVADRQCGRIHGGDDRGPRDLGRDAQTLLLHPGDAVMLANVDHGVTPLASGSRALLSCRLSCPAAARREVVRRT